jgi:hypothetical protein
MHAMNFAVRYFRQLERRVEVNNYRLEGGSLGELSNTNRLSWSTRELIPFSHCTKLLVPDSDNSLARKN